jgi:hypothetical protein
MSGVHQVEILDVHILRGDVRADIRVCPLGCLDARTFWMYADVRFFGVDARIQRFHREG